MHGHLYSTAVVVIGHRRFPTSRHASRDTRRTCALPGVPCVQSRRNNLHLQSSSSLVNLQMRVLELQCVALNSLNRRAAMCSSRSGPGLCATAERHALNLRLQREPAAMDGRNSKTITVKVGPRAVIVVFWTPLWLMVAHRRRRRRSLPSRGHSRRWS